jgi:hypothetical protein
VAVRYTAYCKKTTVCVTPQQLLSGVRQADLLTIAEGDQVPKELAESAEEHLAIADMAPDKPFTFYRLTYLPGTVRQIDVERWSSIEEVRGELAELVGDLEAEENPVLPRIRAHLDSVVDIVDVSFGSSPGEAMAPILASEVTRWLAEQFDGIIRAADDTWWYLESAGEFVELTP